MTPVIGGISITGLQVYDQRPGPDGINGGCPHLHAIAHELYLVTEGHGRVEFHEPERGLWIEPLRPGDIVQFPPGILHRIVAEPRLHIVAILAHAGLAEAGDARIWFGPSIDADAEAYAASARLPANASLEDALARRDRAAEGYAELLRWWEHDRERYRIELRAFRQRHAAAMAAKPGLEDRLRQAHPAWGEEGLKRLGDLPGICTGGLPHRWSLRNDTPQRFGMCGLLRCIT